MSGEAATRPGFLGIVRSVIQAIPEVRQEAAQTKAAIAADIELVIPDDPTFVMAKGAAFWLRMRMDLSYCRDFMEPFSASTLEEVRDEL